MSALMQKLGQANLAARIFLNCAPPVTAWSKVKGERGKGMQAEAGQRWCRLEQPQVLDMWDDTIGNMVSRQRAGSE